MPKPVKHLRSQGASSPERAPAPNPDRHLSGVPQKNPEHHKICNDSSSPRYAPKRAMYWVNQNQRPPWKPSDESAVDRTRHSDCQISSNPKWNSLEYGKRKKVRVSARPRSAPISMHDNFYLQHPELRRGDKTYLWSVAKVYSSANMKVLKQNQYEKLLLRQEILGFHTLGECKKYQKYLTTERKMHFANPAHSPTSSPRNRPSTAPDRRRRKTDKDHNHAESQQQKQGRKMDETADKENATESNSVSDSSGKSDPPEQYQTQNRTSRPPKKSRSSETSETDFPKGLESRERAKTARHRSRPKHDDSERHQQTEADSKEDEEERKVRVNSAKTQDDNSRPKTGQRSKSAKSGESRKMPNKSRPGTGKSKRSDEAILPRSSPYLEDLTRSTPPDWRVPPQSARSRKPNSQRQRPGSSAHAEGNDRPKTSVGRRPQPTPDENDEKVRSDEEKVDEQKAHDDAEDDEKDVQENKSEKKKKKKRYLTAEGTTRPKSRLGNRQSREDSEEKETQETEKEKKDGPEEEVHENRDKEDSKLSSNQEEGKPHSTVSTTDDDKRPSGTRDDDKPPSSTRDDDKQPSSTRDDDKTPSSTRDGDKPPSSTRDDDKTPSRKRTEDDEYLPSNREDGDDGETREEESHKKKKKKKKVSKFLRSVTQKEQNIAGINLADAQETQDEPTGEPVEENTSQIKDEKDSEDVHNGKEIAEPVEGSNNTTTDQVDASANTFNAEIVKSDDEQRKKDDSKKTDDKEAEIQENDDTITKPLDAENAKIVDSDVDKEPVQETQVVEEKEFYVTKTKVVKIEKSEEIVKEEDKSETAPSKDIGEEKTHIKTQSIEKSTHRESKTRFIANTEVIESEEIVTPSGRKLTGFSARIKSYQQAKDILEEMKTDLLNTENGDGIPYACRYPTATSVSEHFDSNGIHGAGLELLRLLVEKNVSNAAVFVIVRRGSAEPTSDFEVKHVISCAKEVYEALPP